MIEEILPDFYRIEVPLPRNPLKSLNSYLIKGQGRNLLIDTGFNREECKKALFDGLRTLEVNLAQTDLFITHLHADHSGLISAIATKSSAVYCSKTDAALINLAQTNDYWSKFQTIFSLHGFPLQELDEAIQKHPGHKFIPDQEQEFSIVKENDTISVGNYHFTCIETPGHTPGHMCLYEPHKKILVSGDHILADITPNINIEKGLVDPLGHYLKNLDRINQLEINLVLPGHRHIIDNIHSRIAELKQHHAERLGEVLSILNTGCQMNAYQVAKEMSWNLTCTSWEQFPVAQKWFATGEAISHLLYLSNENKIRRIDTARNVLFELIA